MSGRRAAVEARTVACDRPRLETLGTTVIASPARVVLWRRPLPAGTATPVTGGDGQAVCGTPQAPLRAAASRP